MNNVLGYFIQLYCCSIKCVLVLCVWFLGLPKISISVWNRSWIFEDSWCRPLRKGGRIKDFISIKYTKYFFRYHILKLHHNIITHQQWSKGYSVNTNFVKNIGSNLYSPMGFSKQLHSNPIIMMCPMEKVFSRLRKITNKAYLSTSKDNEFDTNLNNSINLQSFITPCKRPNSTVHFHGSDNTSGK